MSRPLPSQASVVVIGGGVMGCSTLYHLTREGWTDVVLVERDELTSGSTWHAAAQVTQFGANQTMVGLKRHSIDLYRELAADPENTLLWRFDMRRLTAEEIRDSILAANGTLNLEIGGPGVYPPLPEEVLATSSTHSCGSRSCRSASC